MLSHVRSTSHRQFEVRLGCFFEVALASLCSRFRIALRLRSCMWEDGLRGLLGMDVTGCRDGFDNVWSVFRKGLSQSG